MGGFALGLFWVLKYWYSFECLRCVYGVGDLCGRFMLVLDGFSYDGYFVTSDLQGSRVGFVCVESRFGRFAFACF